MRWIQDQMLAALQRRCDHPGEMVAADVLEGCGGPVVVQHCRRCGAVRPVWESLGQTPTHTWEWRKPDPNLWRGNRR
jgi:hypothetical protein